METELKRLCEQLRSVAGEAGLLLVTGAAPEAVAQCVQQYNEVVAQVSLRLPVLRPEVLPLDSGATAVRMAARSLAARLEEHRRHRSKSHNPLYMF
jgi:hypothetical protein